jgi:hypothetical protein
LLLFAWGVALAAPASAQSPAERRVLPATPVGASDAPGRAAGRQATPLPLGSAEVGNAGRGPVGGTLAGVRLLPGASSVVHFVVDVPEAALGALEGEPGLTTVEIAGFETSAPAGEPAVPRRVVNVAVPPSGEVRVRAEGGDAVLHDAIVLAPAPTVRPDAPERKHYVREPAAYRRDEPGARARLLGVSWMRNQRVARVEILPAEYLAARGALRLHRTVTVEVDVISGEATVTRAEVADPFEALYRQVLVNYEQGRSWRRSARASDATRRPPPGDVRREARMVGAQGGPPVVSIYAGRLWAKIAIEATGFYKVDFATLRNLGIFAGSTTTNVDSVRLFNWPGHPVLPEKSYCDTCDYREVAMQFVENGNGILDDNSEYLYFFAMGPSDWANLYDPALPDTVFVNNPYETRNYYYLTVATPEEPVGFTPKRIGTRSGTIVNPGATTPATFDAREHFEDDLEYFPDPTPRANIANPNTLFWEKWYWRSMSVQQSYTATADVPGADTGQPFRMRLSTWGITSDFDTCFFVRPPDHTIDVQVNGLAPVRRAWNLSTGHVLDTTFAGGVLQASNSIRVEVPRLSGCPRRIDRGALAWIDLFFQRRFDAFAGALTFDSPAVAGDYLYRIGSFTQAAPPRVFDVTDSYDPIEITGLEYVDVGGSFFRLSFESVEPGLRRYRVIQDAAVVELDNRNVADAALTSLVNLRATPTDGAGAPIPVDYLVIYWDGFKAAADTLTEWRKTRLPLGGAAPPYGTLSVPVSALYDQFSGGRVDPSALRNFLRAAFYNWPLTPGGRAPAFVTMLGDGSHDFKNYLGRAAPGQPGTLLPSWEGGYDIVVRRQYATDDWLLNVDDTEQVIPDFFGGRIPAGDANAALVYVRNKLLAYERRSPTGEWRNRVMFIADDDKQGASDDALRWTHVAQSSQLDSSVTPNHIDRKYVYLHKYPDGPGDTKPGAKTDIIKTINEGVLMVNFIGHGSPFKMTDESVFLDTDTGALTNAERLTVFVAASCDIGKFNDPTVQSLGERLLIEPQGGAVGVISATELALSSQNAQLNRTLYSEVFERQAGGGPYQTPMAQALNTAKLGFSTTEKYMLMGDAGLRLNLPRLWANLTLWDSAGTTPITEVKRGQTVMVKGQVVEWPSGNPASFNGVAALLVEDSAPLEQAPPCTFQPNCFSRPFYYYAAGPVFRGEIGVSGGMFQGRFVAPLEARLGTRGRLRAYLEGQVATESFAGDGVGDLRVPVAAGTQVTLDNEGPRITLSFPGDATAVRPDALLTVDLFDPSGILTTGHTPQNGIVVTVDENTTNRVDITSSFRYAADSYQSGTASFQLPNLSEGPHRIEVSAADNLAAGLGAGAHRSSVSLDFLVVDEPPLEIRQAYLFPNPAQSGGPGSGGQFVVDAPGDSINVLVKVYTPTGKMIRSLESFGGLGQVQIPWDGLDEIGLPLGNGVYFFRVHVNPMGPDGKSEAGRKATVQGRFVVVNR